MLSIIRNNSKSILNVAIKQQPQQIINAFGSKAPSKGKGKKKGGDEDDDDNKDASNAKYDIKVSKGSYQKIIQRFTSTWRRPDSIAKDRTSEEQQVRQFIYEFGNYSKEIAEQRDAEESDKLDYQWDAIMELPEDLRKIALLVDTHDEQPSLIPLLFDSPPTPVDPKSTVQLKKKQKVKPSQRLLLNV